VPNPPRPAIFELRVAKGGQQRRQFRLDRLFDELARAARITPVSASGAKPDGSGKRVMVSPCIWHIPFPVEN
jgi:hypothetical protein